MANGMRAIYGEVDRAIREAERPKASDPIVDGYLKERSRGAISEWVIRAEQEQKLAAYWARKRRRATT